MYSIASSTEAFRVSNPWTGISFLQGNRMQNLSALEAKEGRKIKIRR